MTKLQVLATVVGLSAITAIAYVFVKNNEEGTRLENVSERQHVSDTDSHSVTIETSQSKRVNDTNSQTDVIVEQTPKLAPSVSMAQAEDNVMGLVNDYDPYADAETKKEQRAKIDNAINQYNEVALPVLIEKLKQQDK